MPAAGPSHLEQPGRGVSLLGWVARVLSLLALVVVVWALVTEAGAVVHGQPSYAVLLGLTAAGGATVAWFSWRRGSVPGRARRRFLKWVAAVLAVGWIASLVYLRPFTAGPQAVAAMASDQAVSITETSSRVVLQPKSGPAAPVGVFFQPGARVDARAYVPTLRSLAEAGYLVVIEKQPLNIAFFAAGALERARGDFPDITNWVVGGHSLGGTVAALEAVEGQSGAAPATGLFFWASYPADSIRETYLGAVESVSGSRDGLATPAKIDASRADLPASTSFVVIEGASHAQFGDYGPQPGDQDPTISDTVAQAQISRATLGFVQSVESG